MGVSHASSTKSHSETEDDRPLRARIRENPGPALRWMAGMFLLFIAEAGALFQTIGRLLVAIAENLPGTPGIETATWLAWKAQTVPTLLSRETIPNQGHWNGSEWVGTFAGLEPAQAWGLRVALIYLYSCLFVLALWYGYLTYRSAYRTMDWTPRDDQLRRLRHNNWGMFGLTVVILFLIMAAFAPAMSPTTIDQNIQEPYSYEISYWNDDLGQVSTILVGDANFQSVSKGNPDQNVGIMQSDDFGRFHPFGTMNNGKDLFTIIAFGSRISLFIGVTAISLAGTIATLLALTTAYFKGLADLTVVLVSDSIQSVPSLMLLIAAGYLFSDTWVATLYDGAVLLALLFALIYWPGMWRAIRGPSFQVAQEEWVDAARSYGQRPLRLMRTHMLPYIMGYLLVYASMSFAGVIISTAGLSFIGFGINAPTPSWGRAINAGQPFVAQASWHISLIPGILITILCVGFNALGDGIRDAIDPESESHHGEGGAAGGGA